MNKLAKLGTVLIALALAATVTGCSTAGRESKASPSEVARSTWRRCVKMAGLKNTIRTPTDRRRRVRRRNTSFLETLGSVRPPNRKPNSPGHAGQPFKVEYTIIDEQVDGENATVTVALRGLDLSSSLETQFRDDRRADD